MTDLTSLGYPQGYHLGFSSLLWWIFIIVTAILGLGLYLNARKSDLINVKEMLRAKFYLYICTSIQVSLIQVAVFLPNFLQFYFLGAVFTTFSNTFYFYYWEKNLTRIKRIPTISVGTSFIVTFIALIISIFITDLPDILLNLIILSILLLNTITLVLYIYLIYVFSRDIKGGHMTIVGWIWIVGTVLTILALFIEHIGVKFFPTFISFYLSPIIYMFGLSMAFYGITKLFPHISSFYAYTQRCAVHLGTIEKGNPIHYCSSCGIAYCETCFNNVIKKDGCWNCRKGAELEDDKELLIDDVLETNKPDKLKKSFK